MFFLCPPSTPRRPLASLLPPGAPSQTPHAPGVALQQGTRLLPRAVPRVNPSLCALPSCGQCKIPVLHMHKQNPPSNCLHSRASTFHVKPDGSPPPPPPTLRGSVGCKKITGHFQVSPFFKGFYFLDTDTSTILLRPRQGTGLRSLLQAEPAPPAPQALIINFGAHVKKHKHKAALGRRSTNNSVLLGGERQDFHLSPPPPAPHSISHCL